MEWDECVEEAKQDFEDIQKDYPELYNICLSCNNELIYLINKKDIKNGNL